MASLSQDEIDALLNDMSGGSGMEDEGPAVDAGFSSDIPADYLPLVDALEESLIAGCAGAGVMIAATSQLDNVSRSHKKADAKDPWADHACVFVLNMSGAVHGELALCIPSDEAAKIIVHTMGVEQDAVSFSEEELDAVKEIMGPILQGLSRTLGAKAGGAVQADVKAVLTDGSFPVSASSFVSITGDMTIEGSMQGRLELLVPDLLLNTILSSQAPKTETNTSSSSSSDTDSRGKSIINKQNLPLLLDVEMPLTVELGRTQMYIKEILSVGEGSIIELDKLAGDAVDLMVNGKLIARGEVVVIDENFGVRVTEIVSPRERLQLGR
jgi:flagellar motor switch protein FliN/FliY